MIETLAEKKCTPCRGGVPPLTLAEAKHFRSQTSRQVEFTEFS
jgi:4a-hydroxytetrahydrobiopterin dehydratase